MVAKFPNNDVRKPLEVLQSGVELSDLSPLFVPEDIALALIRVVSQEYIMNLTKLNCY